MQQLVTHQRTKKLLALSIATLAGCVNGQEYEHGALARMQPLHNRLRTRAHDDDNKYPQTGLASVQQRGLLDAGKTSDEALLACVLLCVFEKATIDPSSCALQCIEQAEATSENADDTGTTTCLLKCLETDTDTTDTDTESTESTETTESTESTGSTESTESTDTESTESTDTESTESTESTDTESTESTESTDTESTDTDTDTEDSSDDDCIKTSRVSSSKNGKSFSDGCHKGGIKEIRWAAGDEMNGIQLVYRDDGKGDYHGKYSPNKTKKLGSNEEIIKVRAKEHKHDYGMEFVKFKTTKGRWIELKTDGNSGEDGKEKTFEAPSGYILGGFHGKTGGKYGNSLITLGVYWVKD